MPNYPRAFALEPIGDWPGPMTEHRQRANFRTPGYQASDGYHGPQRVPLSKTLGELETSFAALKATNPRLLVAITSGDLRLDGRLRAGATPWHPGVILVFDTPAGEMRYPADLYTHWEDNLRAISLTLTALRSIERHGVAHGQQYGGFLAIESARAMPSTPFSREPSSVRAWLLDLIDETGSDDVPGMSVPTPKLLRKAQAATHPDLGGDPELFRLVSLAEVYLREANEL